jgi:hypothetical protein
MKFAHMADCHIGSWRDPKLKDISTKAFLKAADLCIEKKVDFILISGDLFNTSLPHLEGLKSAVIKLKELKDKDIPVYVIPGSHDFSPSGKTMLDVLEGAGLFVNVAKGSVEDNKLRLKFTIDKKTGAKITGLLGKKGSLERSYYEALDTESLEKEPGYKIFMFHTALAELKPDGLENMESQPLSLLPKNFSYYAGGHVHYVLAKEEAGFGVIAFPGPLFPNNFKELEDLGRGGFYIVENNKPQWEPIQIYNTYHIKLDCKNKTPKEIEAAIMEEIKNKEFIDTIVTIRLFGTLKTGKPSDINFREIFSKLYDKSAYFVMKNTNKLISPEFEEVKLETKSVEDIEENLIKEHMGQIKVPDLTLEKEEKLTKELIKILSMEKDEGERVIDFENRIKKEVSTILDINK